LKDGIIFNVSGPAYDYLTSYFSPEQIGLIELAFERGDGWYPADTTDDDNAVEFGERYQYNTNRMKAIMQNIINNNGTFVP
jgi:hypothetical protein